MIGPDHKPTGLCEIGHVITMYFPEERSFPQRERTHGIILELLLEKSRENGGLQVEKLGIERIFLNKISTISLKGTP